MLGCSISENEEFKEIYVFTENKFSNFSRDFDSTNIQFQIQDQDIINTKNIYKKILFLHIQQLKYLQNPKKIYFFNIISFILQYSLNPNQDWFDFDFEKCIQFIQKLNMQVVFKRLTI